MTEEERVKQLFDCTMIVASTAKTAHEDNAILRDGIERFIKRVDEARVVTAKELSDQASELKKNYAPDAVKTAVERSKGAVDKFYAGINSNLATFGADTSKVVRRLLVWSLLISALSPTFAILAVWLVLGGIPSVDAIQARRSEAQSLEGEINALSLKKGKATAEFEVLRDRLVFSNGQWYARYDGAPVNICVTSNRCGGPYVLVK